MSDNDRRRGRPRDESISKRALAAVRELLVERGFDGTSIQAVSERSGVHSSAIYRRWPSRIELIEEATFPGFSAPDVEPTGDLRHDLAKFVRSYLDTLGAPAARAAAAGLIAHRQSSPEPETSAFYLRVSTRPQLREILRAAPASAVDPAVDPDDVFDMLLGAVLAHGFLPAAARRPEPAARITDMLVRMLRPGSDDAGDPAP